MKKYSIFFTALFIFSASFSQIKKTPYKHGEWLKYKMSYSGFLRAGSAVLEVKEKELNGKNVFYTKGTGWTTGMIKWFFAVEDKYESYFDKEEVKPYLFKRNIKEGGYKRHRVTSFNYDTKKAYVQDFTSKKDSTIAFSNVQDMLSSFYYLRSRNVKNMKVGEEIAIDMFLDFKVYPFKLRFLGKEILKTKFGKVKTLIFRPLVQSGRIFKAQESVTIWISDDNNKIPVKLQADLAVGSLRADLEKYKGLSHTFVTK